MRKCAGVRKFRSEGSSERPMSCLEFKHASTLHNSVDNSEKVSTWLPITRRR